MSLVLIDTSIWIDLLRNAEASGLARMQSLLEARRAAWCGMVRLELWSGIRDDKQQQELAMLEAIVQDVEITNTIWRDARERASTARANGLPAPATDHVIFACARMNNMELWHRDKHFDAMADL